ncbi:Hypothetical predicted protein, partial [Paramuricea clavata]
KLTNTTHHDRTSLLEEDKRNKGKDVTVLINMESVHRGSSDAHVSQIAGN